MNIIIIICGMSFLSKLFGGGSDAGKTSQVVNDSVTNIVLNVMTQNAAKVSTGGTSVMDLSFNASGPNSRNKNITITQAFEINVAQFNSASNLADIQNKIIEQLRNAITQNSGGFDILSDAQKTSILNRMNTAVSANITNQTLNEFAGQFNQQMKIRFNAIDGGLNEDINVSQDMKAAVQVVNNAVNNMGFSNDIQRTADNTTQQSTENPIAGAITALGSGLRNVLSGVNEVAGTALSGTFGRFMIIAIIFIIVIGIIAVTFMYSDVGKQLTSTVDIGKVLGAGDVASMTSAAKNKMVVPSSLDHLWS